jgi:16S rRNA (guanine(527)-N(7))-methyltransferase RsmG
MMRGQACEKAKEPKRRCRENIENLVTLKNLANRENFRDRLAERAGRVGVQLASEATAQLEAYFRLLARWNAKINLTAFPLDSPTDEAVDRLLIEPLLAARYVADSPLSWFDFGSGGGSPAIPLKILRTNATLTMVESRGRKAAFLREVIRELQLPAARVENARFENLVQNEPKAAQLVTIRAVRSDRSLFRAVAKLLGRGGRMLWFGANQSISAEIPGFQVAEVAKKAEMPGYSLIVLDRVFHVEQNR